MKHLGLIKKNGNIGRAPEKSAPFAITELRCMGKCGF